MAEDTNLTVLLREWAAGDATALERLLPSVYPELYQLARSYLRRDRGGPDLLQATAVVNELFLKLLANVPMGVADRQHFYAVCAVMMRHAMVDHYRRSASAKRGGPRSRVPLHDELLWVDANSPAILDLDSAMQELAKLDRQQADLFGMRFVLGCTADEAAELTGLSKTTVDRKVRLARLWLFARLQSVQRGRNGPEPAVELAEGAGALSPPVA